MKIKIGSRKSRLALIQSELIKKQLTELGDFDCEIVHIDTKGDQILDRALHKVGDKGLFTAELEECLKTGEIDLAVHSLKDLPTKINPELPIMAITKREEPWDCAVFNDQHSKIQSVLDLPKGSVIGTSSLRRIAQLKNKRPDFQFYPLRGNVETRIRKVKSGGQNLSAGILALAGMNRLGLREQVDEVLNCGSCIPAPGQGALAVQASKKNSQAELWKFIQKLNDRETEILVGAERSSLESIDGGCQTPFAAYATRVDLKQIKLVAALGSPHGDKLVINELIGPEEDYRQLGVELGNSLKLLLDG